MFSFKAIQAGKYFQFVFKLSAAIRNESMSAKIVRSIFFLCFFSSMLLCSSCKKKEGMSGKHSIKGTIKAHYYDQNLTTYTGDMLAPDEDVYIIYGDAMGYGDKTSTDYRGQFEFRYLAGGNYTVYVYSDDIKLENPSGVTTVVKQVNLSGDHDMGVIEINKKDERKLDEGAYSISGTISVKFCNAGYTYCTGPFGTPNVDVFISKLGEEMNFDRIRTSDGGFYKFMQLPAGSYVVFVTSQNPLSAIYEGEPPLIVKKDTVIITTENVANINFETVE